jgi:hypothetical protein
LLDERVGDALVTGQDGRRGDALDVTAVEFLPDRVELPPLKLAGGVPIRVEVEIEKWRILPVGCLCYTYDSA